MSYKGDRRGKSREARHVRLYHWLLGTEAWKDLNATERAVYIEIAQRYAGTGTNNGRIPYSVREGAKALRVGTATISRALDSLVSHGFLKRTKTGGFSLKLRHATEWQLTEFPSDISSEFVAPKDFTRWSLKMQNSVVVEKPKVVELKPNGAGGETAVAKKSRLGSCAETVRLETKTARFQDRHTSSLPGDGAETASERAHRERRSEQAASARE